jgi:hypothetical protein
MQTVTVPATQDFEHEGRTYHRGDAVTVAPLVACMLSRRDLVSIEGGAKVEIPVRTRVKRRYRRRDLTAEP